MNDGATTEGLCRSIAHDGLIVDDWYVAERKVELSCDGPFDNVHCFCRQGRHRHRTRSSRRYVPRGFARAVGAAVHGSSGQDVADSGLSVPS